MTYSAIPVLRRDPARWAEWGKLVTSSQYDRRQVRAAAKTGATVGMAMTEKQGGSDLRQTQTHATPNGDGSWSIVGHKWFFSVPHSDVFLTLARTDEGVSCFVVAGWLPDGRAIVCRFSGSRTSAATNRTRHPKSNSVAPLLI